MKKMVLLRMDDSEVDMDILKTIVEKYTDNILEILPKVLEKKQMLERLSPFMKNLLDSKLIKQNG